ncbi:MAG: hypothetical protein KDG54_15050 [Geminicoccaceae bacterium]|nr:hypothetical protein [Geminicoccaceae bacterium]
MDFPVSAGPRPARTPVQRKPCPFRLRARLLRMNPLRILRFCLLLALDRQRELEAEGPRFSGEEISVLRRIWPMAPLLEAVTQLGGRGRTIGDVIAGSTLWHLQRLLADLAHETGGAMAARMFWIERIGRGRVEEAAKRLAILLARRVEQVREPGCAAKDRGFPRPSVPVMQGPPTAGQFERQVHASRQRSAMARGRRLLLRDLAGRVMQDLAHDDDPPDGGPASLRGLNAGERRDVETTLNAMAATRTGTAPASAGTSRSFVCAPVGAMSSRGPPFAPSPSGQSPPAVPPTPELSVPPRGPMAGGALALVRWLVRLCNGGSARQD